MSGIDINEFETKERHPCFGERNNKEDKKQLILDAMIRCVRKYGFHAASMSEISKEAGISVGIIYRYFENKEAMIEALIARDLDLRNDKFAEWANTPDDILFDTVMSFFNEIVDFNYDKETAGVGLEIISEAARNERVAAMITKVKERERKEGIDLWRRIAPHLSDDELLAFNDIIVVLFNGIMVHSIISKNSKMDLLKDDLRIVVKTLLVKK